MDQNEKTAVTENSLNCKSCGAVLRYEPGTEELKCSHCGASNQIIGSETSHDIESYNYDEFVDYIQSAPPVSGDLQAVSCKNCGSKTTLPKNVTADKCPFCSSPLIIELNDTQDYVRPHYILPFAVNQQTATDNFKNWIKGLSFAPNDLAQKISNSSKPPLDGVYLPFWSYDADAFTSYDGSRGEHYWETETYVEEVDGEQREMTREVMRTSWWPVSGTVQNNFEDLLVPASNSLPAEMLNKVGGWQFSTIVEYDERYISGFRAENYQLVPQNGLESAKKMMDAEIDGAIRDDIGGDEQQVYNSSTELSNVGIKYLLLPVWVTSYVYKGTVYQVTINASTGEVHGHRPYSAMKITVLVIAIIIILAILFFVFAGKG